jgi:hypothetical protein
VMPAETANAKRFLWAGDLVSKFRRYFLILFFFKDYYVALSAFEVFFLDD